MPTNSAKQMPLLELDLLKTLVAIHETGNFSKAGELLFRTPSAVSMQVKRLEDMLGRPVFNRDSRTVTLTSEGETLITHARRLLALNREMMAKFQTPDISGEVRLGAVDNTAEQVLPDTLKRFAETHPGIAVEATVENSAELAARVKAGKLDLALITATTNEYAGLPVELLYSEELVWAGLKCGVAGEQSPLPISVWEEGCVWRSGALERLEERDIDYIVTFKSAYVAGQKAAIQGDLVVAPIPRSLCDDDIVDVTERFGLPRLPDYHIGLITTEERSPHVDAVSDHLRASFDALAKSGMPAKAA